jgi:hypothetical protein
MASSPRISTSLRNLAIAAAAVIAAGCAGTPQQAPVAAPPGASPSAASTTNTPASTSELARTASFTTKAEQYGWHPAVRDGEVVYCKEEVGNGGLSRIPRRTCLDRTGVQAELLAEEHQREQIQKAAAAAGSSSGPP